MSTPSKPTRPLSRVTAVHAPWSIIRLRLRMHRDCWKPSGIGHSRAVKSPFRDRWPGRLGVLLVLVIVSATACVNVTPSSRLTRSPYLTAVFADRATVNWATDRSDDEASLHWG